MAYHIINLNSAHPGVVANTMFNWREHRDVLINVMGLSSAHASFVQEANSPQEIIDNALIPLNNRNIPGNYVRMFISKTSYPDSPIYYQQIETAPPVNNWYSVVNSYGISSAFLRFIMFGGNTSLVKAFNSSVVSPMNAVQNARLINLGLTEYQKRNLNFWDTTFLWEWCQQLWDRPKGSMFCNFDYAGWEGAGRTDPTPFMGSPVGATTCTYPAVLDEVYNTSGMPNSPGYEVTGGQNNTVAWRGVTNAWPWMEIDAIHTGLVAAADWVPSPTWTTGPFRTNWTTGSLAAPGTSMYAVYDGITKYEWCELAYRHLDAFYEYVVQGMPCDWKDWPKWRAY